MTGGSITETPSELGMPVHTHIDPDGVPSDFVGGSGPINNLQEEIALRWLIATQGVFPSRTGTSYDGLSPILGEMALFAGNFAPAGWAEASGQLIDINSNDALFSVIGTQYGGDGRTTFALPDMRGRVAVGSAGGFQPLARGGTERISLSANNLPSHTHTVPVPVVPLPAAGWLLLAAIAGMAALRRRATA